MTTSEKAASSHTGWRSHVQFMYHLISRHRTRRWTAAALGLLLLSAIGGSSYAVASRAGTSNAPAMAPARTALSQSETMQPFDATGLPAGAARGMPVRRTFPPGFNLKHVHGGPTYVYVISGSLDIIDSQGT